MQFILHTGDTIKLKVMIYMVALMILIAQHPFVIIIDILYQLIFSYFEQYKTLLLITIFSRIKLFYRKKWKKGWRLTCTCTVWGYTTTIWKTKKVFSLHHLFCFTIAEIIHMECAFNEVSVCMHIHCSILLCAYRINE